MEYSMTSPIIAALRRYPGLKESVQHTLQELAHMASIYGVVRVSYDEIAWKSSCSPRTAIRHIKVIEDVQIVKAIRQKSVVRRKDLPLHDRGYSSDPIKGHERVFRNEINQYRFLIKWDKSPHHPTSSNTSYDKVSRTFPPPKEREKRNGWEQGKEGSLQEKIEKQRRFLREVDPAPGSFQWEIAQEEIARLEVLLSGGDRP